MASVAVEGAEYEQVRDFLSSLEAATGVPPVDEDEQRRLASVPPIRDRDWSWGGHLARIDAAPVAYAGIRLPPVPATHPEACSARVDLALDREHPAASDALVAALTDARDHVRLRGHGAQGRVEAWLRGATEQDLEAARLAGFRLAKRLHVMTRRLDGVLDTADAIPLDPGATPVPDGLVIRSFRADDPADTAAVIALLSAAYPGGEGGWDAPGFAVRRATEWFRAEDLLLLEDAATGASAPLLGVHWTKRRGAGVGEVHNLALDPSVRGRGLGGVLLDAGLAHLAGAGCRAVLLWVDAANAPALALYGSRGFERSWDDVALVG